ncbi:MAG: glycosyltransferase family 2 protein [Candidatus Omnitrophica bacterium]|nr:glycosyltransferase family 2 protein [Candidatus Omnitrophota bacterium]
MKLSVVMPAHNEEDCIQQAVTEVVEELVKSAIEYELVLVNDNSTDSTPEVARKLQAKFKGIKIIDRTPPGGFGRAVRDGLDAATGGAVVIVMGDMSDDPKDIVRYFRKIEEGYDCVFGSRFIKGSIVKDYPPLKLFINRLANNFIRTLFFVKQNDITNAFKIYRRGVIEACRPFLAPYFNITVEIPLKAVNRKFKVAQMPISWYGRKSGVSKLRMKEMGRKYLFTVLYVWLERILLKDELRRP